MLPNHAPLMVAERFKVLEALFPGRIDRGLGRAPGTDPVTSYALRVRQDPRAGDEFLERFQELLLLEHGGFLDGLPFRNVRAVPSDVMLPPIWLLGSSGYSADLTRPSIASGWRVSAPTRSPSGVACSPWPRRREPMNL
jgi:alkanesulfonate monooxygenase SsuD/methylene tetrahydromethanopterin reductase-like flavin-dependent oxidoreductase (luciferase family)